MASALAGVEPLDKRQTGRALKSILAIPAVRFLICVATVLVTMIPVLIVEHPAGADAQNHLARHLVGAIERAAENGADLTPRDRALLDTYAHEIRLLPNIGGDLLMNVLTRFLNVEAAAKFMLALSLALIVISPVVLYRAIHNSWSLWPLVAAPLAWNASTAWGFENYILGAGISVFAFAFWIKRPPGWVGIFAAILISAAVYICHVIAFGMLGLLVGSWELRSFLRNVVLERAAALRMAAALACVFVLPVIHFLTVRAGAMPGRGDLTLFGGFAVKVRALVAPTNHGMDDRATLVVLAGLIVLLTIGLTSRALRLAPQAAIGLVLLTLVAIFAPYRMNGVALMDIRLPFLCLLLLIASLRFEPHGGFEWKAPILASVLLGLTVLPVTHGWLDHDRAVADLRQGLRKIPIGARVIAMADKRAYWTLRHAGAYAVVDRGAFMSALFTGASPLTVRPPLARLDHPVPARLPVATALRRWRAGESLPADTYWHRWWLDFDYVYVAADEGTALTAPSLLEPIHRSKWTGLYRIRRTQTVQR